MRTDPHPLMLVILVLIAAVTPPAATAQSGGLLRQHLEDLDQELPQEFSPSMVAAITGTVTHAATGEPLSGAKVTIWSERNNSIVRSRRTGSSGGYSVNVRPGSYFVTASLDGMVGQLHDGVACLRPRLLCDLLEGDLVEAEAATTVSVDFALDPGGAISGTVTDAATGEPLENVEVTVWDALDGCFGPSSSFWVFAAGLTDVEVTLRVTDTVSGEVKEYSNPLGSAFEPVLDTSAFATCP